MQDRDDEQRRAASLEVYKGFEQLAEGCVDAGYEPKVVATAAVRTAVRIVMDIAGPRGAVAFLQGLAAVIADELGDDDQGDGLPPAGNA